MSRPKAAISSPSPARPALGLHRLRAFGTATIDSATGVITYTATAAAGGTDTFTVSDTDSHGVTTTATASFTVDGGPSLSYTAVDATGTGAVPETPVLSSSGGDSFSFAGASGSLGSSVTGAYGTATIDPAAGVITYTPSATAGTAGTDRFTVSDTDGHGVTTTATAVFNVDGGTAATYADMNVTGTSPVTETPTLISPKGGDRFAFVGASGALVSSVTGSFGTATIDAATGEIIYTAYAGASGTDTFTVSDTDLSGVVTTASVTFNVTSGSSGDSWTGAVSSDWTASGNWSEGAPPSAEQASIAAGATASILAGTVIADAVTLSNAGTIEVDPMSAGAVFQLVDGTTIIGGILTIATSGTLDIETGASGPGATLDGVFVTNNGLIEVDLAGAGAVLTLDDGTTISGGSMTIEDLGVLDIEYGGASGGHGATFDGVYVTNNGLIEVDMAGAGAALTLDDGTTISGGNMTVGNSGSGMLDIESGASGPGATLDGVFVTNNGLIEVDMAGAGAVLTLDDGTTISGGNMTVEASGVLDIEFGGASGGHGATLDGVFVTNSGQIEVDTAGFGAVLTLDDGTTISGGNMTVEASGVLESSTAAPRVATARPSTGSSSPTTARSRLAFRPARPSCSTMAQQSAVPR